MERNYTRRQGTRRPRTQEAFASGGCPLGFAVAAHGHAQSAIAPAEDVRCYEDEKGAGMHRAPRL